MDLTEIKRMMADGDLQDAAKALRKRMKELPGDLETKLLYGTCCHLLGDDRTFVRIDDETARNPKFSHSRIWRRYHALRIAACGAVLLAATAATSLPGASTIYNGGGYATLYNGGGYSTLYNGGGASTLYNGGGGWVVPDFSRALVINAAIYSGSRPVGVAQFKTGKVSRKGQMRVSGSLVLMDGRKVGLKATSVTCYSSDVSISLPASTGGSVQVRLNGARVVSGSWSGCRIVSATIGGEIWKTSSFSFGFLPGSISGWDVLYPDTSESVFMQGRRWSFAKAAGMRWKKCPPNASCGYGSWTVDTSNGKSNVSKLKMTYTAKTGQFRGSFTVYTWSPGGRKFQISVSGVVVNGRAYGSAWCKRPFLGPWNVSF